VAVRDEGGGIRKQRGTLVMERCTVTGNNAILGGGLSAADASVNVQIRSSTFSANAATTYDGGGMFIYSGVLTLVDSTLAGNSAAYGAGLMLTTTSQGTITGTTFSNNTASADGGGIYVQASQLTLINSTLSGNSARGFGGGAILYDGSLTLRHSTVAANRANSDNTGAEHGGGLITGAGVMTLDHTIVAGNLRTASTRSDVSAQVALRYSLLGDNTGASLTNNGGNLIGTSSLPINPMLGPLTDNGGQTKTHALLPGSPAVDAGDQAAVPGVGTVPTADQREAPFTRLYDGSGDSRARLDIGAFELQGPGIAADFDDDHDVDGADFLAWQRGLGAQGSMAMKSKGNADSDEDVDAVDLAIWKAGFGAAANLTAQPALATLVVEPRASVSWPAHADAALALQQLLSEVAPRRHLRSRLPRLR
jgi:predicted outer membrane repeat protein